jgi:hypothetical protein
MDVFHAAAGIEPGHETAIVIQRDGKDQVLTIHPSDGA